MLRIVCIVVLIVLLLSGCSTQRAADITEESLKNDSISETKQEPANTSKSLSEELPTSEKKSTEISSSVVKKEEYKEACEKEGWFAGAINGNFKIHMKLDIIDNEIYGVYYYDKYKKNINLSGDINNKFFSVYEDKSNGIIDAVFVTDELIQGVWSDENNSYPVYLVKVGSNIAIPEEPDNNGVKWKGDWKGTKLTYYSGSELNITPIFNNLIQFELSAFNGTHTGGFSAVALINKDNAFYAGENNAEFVFSLNDEGNIELKTNDYNYFCGAGVAYDSIYTNEPLNIVPPTAKEVGLVYSDEQDELFKELTGEYYDTFINYAQIYGDEKDIDGIGAKVRVFGIQGFFNTSIVMINPKDNSIIAAIDNGDAIYYFTNNKKYENLPKTIQNWCDERSGLEVIKKIE